MGRCVFSQWLQMVDYVRKSASRLLTILGLDLSNLLERSVEIQDV